MRFDLNGRLLISVCNKNIAENVKLPEVFLFEVDLKLMQFEPIPIEGLNSEHARGITGLAHYRNGVVALLQYHPSRVAYFSRDYRLIDLWKLSLVVGGHSLAVWNDKIYIASAGTDSIVEFSPEAGERVYWCDNEMRLDSIHVNSLVWQDNKLFATAFGKKKGELWNTANYGYIFHVNKGTKIHEPIYHPHSLCIEKDRFYYCESALASVRSNDGQELKTHLGFTRGLIVSDKYLAVGISRARQRSISTGKPIDIKNEIAPLREQCGILVYRRNGSRLDQCEPIGTIDLSLYANEIFELIPLP